MSDKFQNKYRTASARLPNWDYGSNAMYFVTICTQNREHYFGEIVDGWMDLSAIGKIVENEWIKTFEMRPDMNLQMGEFVVMPNHFHAIITIGKNEYNMKRRTNVGGRNAMHCGSTTNTITINVPYNQFGPQSKNLASIIRGFKSAVTINARKINANFKWQPLYHDHIIRNNESYQRISDYIKNNPTKWAEDKFF